MFDHVGIAVSERFYRTVLSVLSVLGVEPSHADAELVEWEDWAALERTLQHAGIRTDGVELKALPHKVELISLDDFFGERSVLRKPTAAITSAEPGQRTIGAGRRPSCMPFEIRAVLS